MMRILTIPAEQVVDFSKIIGFSAFKPVKCIVMHSCRECLERNQTLDTSVMKKNKILVPA